MTEPKTAEDWGRLAVSLPDWRWMPGMRAMLTAEGHSPVPACPGRLDESEALAYETGGWFGQWPDPDDPATAGCLLALLGLWVRQVLPPRWEGDPWRIFRQDPTGRQTAKGWAKGTNFGRACIAAAAALGRWPGGEE